MSTIGIYASGYKKVERPLPHILMQLDTMPFVNSGPATVTVTTNADVELDTVNQRFGSGCANFLGLGVVEVNPGPIITGDFTIDGWIMATGTSTPNGSALFLGSTAQHIQFVPLATGTTSLIVRTGTTKASVHFVGSGRVHPLHFQH